jgi:hypothetical protein
VPSTLQLAASGTADIKLQFSIPSSTPSGDYDGFVVLTKGSVTIHAPYFVHVLSQAVTPGNVLLIDDTTSRYQPIDPAAAPIVRQDVSRWYERSLTDLGVHYTYWDEGKLGTPTLDEMKLAPVVIFFTGKNLNGLAAQNSDIEAQEPALSATDLTVLHSYLDAGGKLFLTGMGAATSDPLWTIVEMGGVLSNPSLFDDGSNDKTQKGGISPTQPSALPDTRNGPLQASGIFAGLKPIDFSTKGDGAGDNLAVANKAVGQLIGVSGLDSIRGSLGANLFAYGEPALKTWNVPHIQSGFRDKGIDVAIVSADEPSLKHSASYRGRSLLFSFGFEGINDNTGYATRDQVLKRVLQWLYETSSARVVMTHFPVGATIRLNGVLHATQGARVAAYTWQVGNQTLKTSSRPTAYRFPHAGTYRVRVQIDDTLGHVAVSPWTKVKAG